MDKRELLEVICGEKESLKILFHNKNVIEAAKKELEAKEGKNSAPRPLFWSIIFKSIFNNVLPNKIFACYYYKDSKPSNGERLICSPTQASFWTNLLKKTDEEHDFNSIGTNCAEDPFKQIKDLCDNPELYISDKKITSSLGRSKLRHESLAEFILMEFSTGYGIEKLSDCEKSLDSEGIKPARAFISKYLIKADQQIKNDDKEDFERIINDLAFNMIHSIKLMLGPDALEPEEVSYDHLQQIQEDITVPEDEPEQISVPANGPVNFFMFQNSIQNGDIESSDYIADTKPGKYFNNCSVLNTVLKDAFLCGGLLEMCIFDNSELNEANFDNAKISGCKFVGTKIKRSSFQEASLEKNGSVWSDDEIVRSNFDEATIDSVIFSNDIFSNCSFNGTTIKSSSVSDSKLRDTVLDSSLITDTSVSKSELYHCSFKTAKLNNSSINECNLYGCSFTDADLSGVSFEGSTISGGDFCNANLSRASFKDVKFYDGVDMCGADLSGADLQGTVMRELTEEWDIIHRPFTCDYRGAKYCEQEPLKTIFAKGYEYIKKDMIEVDIDGNPIKKD